MIKATPALLLIAIIAALASCKTAPTPCFTVLTPADSIAIGHVVVFDPGCSSDMGSYYWDFGNGQTSSASGNVQTTYDSARTYTVTLVGANQGKTASVSSNITVHP